MSNFVRLPTYAIYLITFTMLTMLIAIICLSAALYLVIKKKQMLGYVVHKQYTRQESTGVSPLYSVQYGDEQNKNSESILTINSGITEVNIVSEPLTPTRVLEPKIIIPKKPFGSNTCNVLPRDQMDEICKEVLKRVQKSDSASFKDLNELLNGKKDGKHEVPNNAVIELSKDEKENECKESNETKYELNTNSKPSANVEVQLIPKHETKTETESESKNDPKLDDTNSGIKSDVNINVNNVPDQYFEDSDTETEYDMVPTPIRFRQSGTGSEDFDVDSIPVYDLLPKSSRNLVQMDLDSHYLLPLTTQQTDLDYVNAKRKSYDST